jgi:hypothetical protein
VPVISIPVEVDVDVDVDREAYLNVVIGRCSACCDCCRSPVDVDVEVVVGSCRCSCRWSGGQM